MTDIRSAQDVAIKDEDTSLFTQVVTDPDISSQTDLMVRGRHWVWDKGNTRWVKALGDSDGRLIVSASTRPSGAADASQKWKGVVKKNDAQFNTYLIPTGKNWIIERFGGGTYSNNAKVELYYGSGADYPGGTWTFITAIYLSVESNEISLNQTFAGDGTKKIAIRLVNNIPTDTEMFGYIVAYEV